MRQMPRFISYVAVILVGLSTGLHAAEINWTTDYQAAFEQAKKQNRPVLLHFWTPSCGPCRQLEHTVFKQDRVAESLNELYVPVKVNAEEFPQLAAKYQVRSVPQDVILSPANEVVHQMHTPRDAEQYVAQLAALAFRANGPNYVAGGNDYRARRPGVSRPGASQTPNDRRARGSAAYETAVAAAESAGASASEQVQLQREELPAPREVINQFAGRPRREQARPEYDSPGYDSATSEQVAETQSPSGRSRWSDWPEGQEPARDELAPQADGLAATTQADRYLDPAPETNGPDQRVGSRSRYSEAAGRRAPEQTVASRDAVEPPPRRRTREAVQTRSPARSAPRASAIAQAGPQKAPLGMDGFCPVTLLKSNAWVEGSPKFGAIHRGRTYLFRGPEEKQRFLDDPDEFSPVLAGIDPVELTASGAVVEGDRAHGVVYRRRVYLFSSEDNLNRFWEAPEEFASPIRQAMEVGELDRLFR